MVERCRRMPVRRRLVARGAGVVASCIISSIYDAPHERTAAVRLLPAFFLPWLPLLLLLLASLIIRSEDLLTMHGSEDDRRGRS